MAARIELSVSTDAHIHTGIARGKNRKGSAYLHIGSQDLELRLTDLTLETVLKLRQELSTVARLMRASG
jgi:hypothetical protein